MLHKCELNFAISFRVIRTIFVDFDVVGGILRRPDA